MRLPVCLGLMVCFLALAGCSSTGKKAPLAAKDAKGGPATAATATAGGKPPAAAANPFNGIPEPRPAVPVSASIGMLAGQVLDSFNRKPGPTFIQVALLRDGGGPSGAPIDVAADAQGYFTIQGLESGKQYQLIARCQDGERKLAGTTFAIPPNPRIVIRVSEDFVTPATPAVPGAPSVPGAAAPPPDWSSTAPTAPPPGWTKVPPPGAAPTTPPGGAGIGAPTPGTNTAVAVDPTRVISINNPAGGGGGVPAVPTRVPSCVLTGQYLANFALNDLTGQPWEFKKHHSKLTLIDFWESACIPCMHAIPHLNVLSERYGGRGLQVVGIAYEEGPIGVQAEKVERVRQRQRIKYTLLLGGGDATPCPVRTQFAIRAFPTLVLVDDTGRILWRCEGLDRQHLGELEGILRQRLGSR